MRWFLGAIIALQLGGRRQGKRFFFEKKNQKTFGFVGCAVLKRMFQPSATALAKAFCFFFSKKKALLAPVPKSCAADTMPKTHAGRAKACWAIEYQYPTGPIVYG